MRVRVLDGDSSLQAKSSPRIPLRRGRRFLVRYPTFLFLTKNSVNGINKRFGIKASVLSAHNMDKPRLDRPWMGVMALRNQPTSTQTGPIYHYNDDLVETNPCMETLNRTYGGGIGDGNSMCRVYHSETYETFAYHWMGTSFYGNHVDNATFIFRTFTKAISKFNKDPVNMSFMFVLRNWTLGP